MPPCLTTSVGVGLTCFWSGERLDSIYKRIKTICGIELLVPYSHSIVPSEGFDLSLCRGQLGDCGDVPMNQLLDDLEAEAKQFAAIRDEIKTIEETERG